MGCGTRLAIGFWVLVGLYFVLWGVGHWLMRPVEVPAQPHVQELIEHYGLNALRGATARAADVHGMRNEWVAIRVDLNEAQYAALLWNLNERTQGGFSQIPSHPCQLGTDLRGRFDWWPGEKSFLGKEESVGALGGMGYALKVWMPDDSLSVYFLLVPRVFFHP